jgi:hypothetical protein
VLRDVVVVRLADGGACVTDLGAYRGQARLLGARVGDDDAPVLKAIDAELLERVRAVRGGAGAGVGGGRPPAVDDTGHRRHAADGASDKDQGRRDLQARVRVSRCAAIWVRRVALGSDPASGQAGSNTAEDHFGVLALASEPLPVSCRREWGPRLARDPGGAARDGNVRVALIAAEARVPVAVIV